MTSAETPDSAAHWRLPNWRESAGDGAALAYIAVIATIASVTGAFFVMFPELGALSQDVFARPRGTWGSSPLLVAITPVLTGVVGSVLTNALPYGLVSVMLVVGASILIIEVLHSPVAPAISAGLLPLVVGIHSWWYAPGIMLGCFLLALLSIPWKRWMAPPLAAPTPAHGLNLDDELEEHPAGYVWLLPLMGFVAAATILVRFTGLRFILFPPLVVIGFEMFGHTDICPWAKRPLWLPAACFLTAAGGLGFLQLFGFGPLTAACDMAWGILVLHLFDLQVPPAFAVALLPLVMDHPTL
ncbi:MAG: HPP family protein, partial [Candidatus Binataceae bacterium]